MYGAKGFLTGTSKWLVAGIILLFLIIRWASLPPMLISLYSVRQDQERYCASEVLTLNAALKCTNQSKTSKHPSIIVFDEGTPKEEAEKKLVSSLATNYLVPVFPFAWAHQTPNHIINQAADFDDSITVMEFAGPLSVIVLTLRPREDPVRLVMVRRAVEYLRHIETGVVVLVVKTHECLSCIPDKMIREVGRLELWDVLPHSPIALYNTNTWIYGRTRTSDVTYGF